MLRAAASRSPRLFSPASSLCPLRPTGQPRVREDTAGLLRAIFTICCPVSLQPPLTDSQESQTRRSGAAAQRFEPFMPELSGFAGGRTREAGGGRDLPRAIRRAPRPSARAAAWQDEVCSFPYLLTRSLFSECLKLITASRNQTERMKISTFPAVKSFIKLTRRRGKSGGSK